MSFIPISANQIDGQLCRWDVLTVPFVFKIGSDGPSTYLDKAKEPITKDNFGFLVHRGFQPQAMMEFAGILRHLHNHSDWVELKKFFEKTFETGKGPKLTKQRDRNQTYRVPVQIDTPVVGLPKTFYDDLDSAGSYAYRMATGRDFTSAFVAPALGVALGLEVMDLCYESKDSKGRGWNDWLELCRIIEWWARRYDSARAKAGEISSGSRGAPPDSRFQTPFEAIEAGFAPQYLMTPSIGAAASMRWVFQSIAAAPKKFQNFEYEAIELGVGPEFCEVLQDRFPENGEVDAYSGPRAAAPCPTTKRAKDWAEWVIKLKPGQIIAPRSSFEARWAIITIFSGKQTSSWIVVLKMRRNELWDSYTDMRMLYM